MINQVDYLRISLIDRCNFQCLYCIPEGAELDYILQQERLTPEELLTLIQQVFIPLGFTRFSLTGGEPLLHPNVVKLVRAIATFPETQDLSLTTNGFLLTHLAQDLYNAGLRRLNISLDSLNPNTFQMITGSHFRWQQVWQGILTAHALGFNPLKLNVVVIPGVNDHEVLELAALSIDRHWHIRFIEFMPIVVMLTYLINAVGSLLKKFGSRFVIAGDSYQEKFEAVVLLTCFRFLALKEMLASLVKCPSAFAIAATVCASLQMGGYDLAC